MTKNNRYVPPQLKMKDKLLENVVSLDSTQVLPGHEPANIKMDNWSRIEDILSKKKIQDGKYN